MRFGCRATIARNWNPCSTIIKKDKADSLKFKAAQYLIRYMPHHYSYAGSYEQYCNSVDSIIALKKDVDSTNMLINACSEQYQSAITLEADIEHISAEYLIRNIDSAYNQWLHGPWAQHLTFDDFCEYLLPYKLTNNQPLDNWRETLYPLYNGDAYKLEATCSDYRNNPRAAVCFINDELKRHNHQKLFFNSNAVQIMRATTLIDKPFGTCTDYAFATAALMRSKGIPVSIDYTPQWPDRYSGHSWNTVLTIRRKKYEFNGFESNPSEEHYPDAKFAKVFRMTYKPNDNLLDLLRRGGKLPPSLLNIFCKDVTDEYIETSDITVDLFEHRVKGNNIYLAVFDNFEWKPVYWGEIKGNKAHFERMGRNVLYMPVLWDGNMVIPFGKLFFLELTGKVRYIETDILHRQDVHLSRKFPMLRHVFAQRDFMRHGKIEVANNADFSDAITIAKLPDWDISSDTINLSLVTPSRFWRFKSSDSHRCDMAEIYFWQEGAVERMKSTVVKGCLRPGLDDFLWFQDDDQLTSLWAEGDDFWAGYDFLEPVSIDRISFIRRGDGNNIQPGMNYELYYWQTDHWKSLGEQTAKDVYLVYKNAPAKALFYIKCLSYGLDNRIFEYINGEVVWR